MIEEHEFGPDDPPEHPNEPHPIQISVELEHPVLRMATNFWIDPSNMQEAQLKILNTLRMMSKGIPEKVIAEGIERLKGLPDVKRPDDLA